MARVLKDLESDWSLHSYSCLVEGLPSEAPLFGFFLLLVNDALLGRRRVSRGRTWVFTLQLKVVGIVRAEVE